MAMMDNNSPQPPERPLLDIMAEKAYIRRLDREIVEDAARDLEKAKNRSSVRQQEKSAYAWRKWLRCWNDERNGH